jgi:Fur family zinc uptake transcriptional regulator
VARIESRRAFVACDPEQSHASIFLLCQQCHSAEQFEDLRLDSLILADASQKRFKVSRPIVELEGLCETCRPSPDDRSA